MPKGKKSAQYQFRVSPETRDLLKKIATALDTPLPDLLITGALIVYSKATNPPEYLRLKAQFLNDSQPQPGSPRGPHDKET